MITISIIIPTYNEADNIAKLIQHLLAIKDSSLVDIIVSDGGSIDSTNEVATLAGANVVVSPVTGRAAQMNHGAAIAKGDVLYFIHADCLPPRTFIQDIQQAINNGYELGRYRTKFNSSKMLLALNEWFTQFDLFFCMGGDQTLFIKKSLFIQCKGFKEDMKIMEDYEFCQRARRNENYKILKGKVLVSARKYEKNTWLEVQLANFKAVRLYKKGASQQQILCKYKQMLKF